VYGVLDLDALVLNGFDKDDEAGLVAISRQVIEPCFKNCE
jgi:putative methionine-R-sulfoxide reductase with GAF domain